MNEEQANNINGLCEIYHRADFDYQIDATAFTLLLSLLGIAPLGNIPQTLQGSINAFRQISHQERYNFTMTAIALLLETPSTNHALQDVFNRLILVIEPLTDGVGKIVFKGGKFNFGSYKYVPLGSLIFCEGSKQ